MAMLIAEDIDLTDWESFSSAASVSADGSLIVGRGTSVDGVLNQGWILDFEVGGGPGVLDNGVPATGLTGPAGGELRFTLEVPAGATGLSFQINGGSGDADLYVQFGSAPTLGSYNCRPYTGGNNETCTMPNATEGTWHVLVHGYSAFAGVSLVGSYTE